MQYLKRLFSGSVLFVFSMSIFGAEWITLTPAELSHIEVLTGGVVNAEAGVYIMHKTTFASSSACTKNAFIAIVDEKLADRAYSAILLSLSMQKTMRFYIDGCTNGYLHAKMFMLLP